MRDKARLERAIRTLRTLMRRHGGEAYLPLARKLVAELKALEGAERELRSFLDGDLAA